MKHIISVAHYLSGSCSETFWLAKDLSLEVENSKHGYICKTSKCTDQGCMIQGQYANYILCLKNSWKIES